ncbi:MAG TPA: ABC transporter ATP-binding protein [Actinomycetota bacterium]|nr:ABC transporter ATP-binding protein [Actinomycetota bacterium]
MSVLLSQGVTIRFGGLTAVDDATIEVPEGGFIGLIGPNGAGKTTMFNAISGFLSPTRGRIMFEGRDVTSMGPSARARLGMGRTFQKLELFGRMSVFDNLMVAAESAESKLDIVSDILSLPRRHSEETRCARIAEDMLQALDLGWARDRRAAELPVGHARILELGRALCTKPKLMLLDEPSSGLDSEETRAFGKLLKRVNEEMGMSILLVEHDMDLVMDVCKSLYVLDFGRLIAQGTPKEIVKDPAVRAAYLGEEDDEAAASPAER